MSLALVIVLSAMPEALVVSEGTCMCRGFLGVLAPSEGVLSPDIAASLSGRTSKNWDRGMGMRMRDMQGRGIREVDSQDQELIDVLDASMPLRTMQSDCRRPKHRQ